MCGFETLAISFKAKRLNFADTLGALLDQLSLKRQLDLLEPSLYEGVARRYAPLVRVCEPAAAASNFFRRRSIVSRRSSAFASSPRRVSTSVGAGAADAPNVVLG